MMKIVQKEDPILRKVAKEVAKEDIGSDKIKKLLVEMTKTLDSCEDGVALAAPQIGESLRIFVVSPRAFAIHRDEDDESATKKEGDKLVYINPIITKRSTRKVTLEEGCLSVRHIFGKIKRYQKVTVEAYDENGQKFTRGATGLLAEIFQHETDHLNGILFIDSAVDLIKMVEKKAENVK